MFTGIVEKMGVVTSATYDKNNLILEVSCDFVHELKVDQSIAHNGVCLTVVNIKSNSYETILVEETLNRTNFNSIKVGEKINLERSLKIGDRLDGHWVTGHVDGTASLKEKVSYDGSWKLFFNYDFNDPNILTVSKGSICVNGVSLTIVESFTNGFSVVIIPYTWQNTNLGQLKVGDRVNIEFDLLGKYIKKIMENKSFF